MQVLPRHALVPAALLLAAALVAAACGGPGANASPTPTAAPSPTPDSHLREPARADVIYSTLVERGLQLIGTNASRGRDPQAVINGTYAGWPLVLLQYQSSGTRQQLTKFKNGDTPGKGDAPFTFAGLNVVVEWGPRVDGRAPQRSVTKAQVDAAATLAAELDRLIGPLAEKSIQRVSPQLATPRPTATARPATPKPSNAPKPPTPRPTR